MLGVAGLAESGVGGRLVPSAATADASAASLFVAGPLERFEPGSVTAFPSGRFYLVRLQDGGFLALHRECTHLGCTVPGTPRKAASRVRATPRRSTSRARSSTPPAPRPLDYYLGQRIENGLVKVDTRQSLSRTSFDPSQVTVA